MCGFAGVFDQDRERPVAHGELRAMLDTLWYRGPDGDGFLEEPGIGLAFARLAIIDLEGGRQPMANEDGSVWVVNNGEIYNFRELRGDLAARGHRFATRSDTEVIVHAYEEWGDACVDALRGIFAFALWDRPRRRLLLARDRTGIKPLHVRFDAGRIAFASEAKALLAGSGVERRLDLLGYLGGADLEAPLVRTAFQGIFQLGAGCRLVATAAGHRIERYWSYRPCESERGEAPEHPHAAFRERFEEAVRMQLVADVPVAAALSGGVDSSALVAAIVRAGRPDIRTYTVDFGDAATDDVQQARAVAAHLGVSNETVPCAVDATTLAALPFVAWAAEGEFDLGYLGRYALSRAVHAAGAKVLLSGQGIDEILTGYWPSYRQYQAAALERHLLQHARPTFRGWPAFSTAAFTALLGRLESGDAAGAPDLPPLARLTAAEMRAEHARLGTSLLRFEDRMGMAGHVEVRVPFLDHPLLELCAGFPDAARRALFSGKALLRDAVADWLPASIARRPKVGFNKSAPAVSRLVLESPGLPELAPLLSRDAVEERGYFDAPAVEAQRRERDFAALDHVLIVHLLDMLFVRDFDPRRFSGASFTRER